MKAIKKFKEMVDPTIWNRGKAYFEDGAVSSLEDEGNGHWDAIVSGNDDYEVSVEIQFGQVQRWDCDCPYEGYICKHVVAAVLAIHDQKETVSIDVGEDKPKPRNFEQMLGTVSVDELRQFVKEYASESKSFKQAFQLHFMEKNLSGGKADYAKLIERSLRSGMERHGFIDYYHAPKAFNVVFSLLNKAENLKKSKNYNEIWQIVSAVIEQISEVTDAIDDSDGILGESFDMAFELIDFLTKEHEVPMSLKEQMLEWHKLEYNHSKYQGYGEDLLLDSMSVLTEVTGRINDVLPLLDVKIKHTNGDYELTMLLLKKSQLLKSSGRLAEYVSLVHENMQFPEFRQLKVTELIEQKRLEEAVTLILEGIQISEKQHHRGTTFQWKQQLLTIYKKTRKSDKYLELLRELFYLSYREYYPLLKSTVGQEKWPEERARIIANLKKNRMDWYFLHELYAAEQMWPELMQVIALNPQYGLIKTYESVLFPLYHEEIIALYEHVCKDFAAKANSRGNYQELASMLKHVGKLKGGKPVITKLVTSFRELYKRRPAMMEELKGFD